MGKTITKFALPALAFLGAWAWLYQDYLPSLLGQWDTEDYSYCFLVPPLFLYFVWQVKDRLVRAGGGRWPGYLALAGAGLLFLAGKLGSLEALVFASMWASLAGGMLLALGAGAIRPLLFPFAVLLFAIPAPPFITNLLSFNLRLISTEMAVSLLHMLSVPAFADGNIIEMGTMKLQVVDACSGLRFFFPTILMSLVIGQLFHRRLWPKLVLLAASAPVSVVTNALRLAITGVLVRYVDPALAEGFFHDFSGLAVNFMSILALAVFTLLMRRFEKPPAADTPAMDATPDGSGPIHFPLAHAGTAAAFLVGLHVFQSLLLGSMIVPDRQTFDRFPMAVGQWQGSRAFLDQEILDALWADDYVQGNFANPATGNVLTLLIPYYEMQTTRHTAHAPAACLLGGGWTLSAKRTIGPNPETGRIFPVHQMVMEKGGRRIISNFWFQGRGRVVTNEYLNKLYLFRDSILMRRTDGALVRVEMLLHPGQPVEEGQRILDEFLDELEDILPEYLPGA